MKARLVLPVLFVAFAPVAASAGTFSYLDPNYVQEVYAVNVGPITSLAFAPNGDVWAVQTSPNALIRFDSQATTVVNGTRVHPIVATVPLPAPAFYQGIANHPDGSLYVTGGPIVRADASSGSVVSTGDCVAGEQLAADPTAPNHLLGVGLGLHVDVDPASLACQDVGGLPDLMNDFDAVFDPTSHDLLTVLAYKAYDWPVEHYDYYVSRTNAGWVAQLPAQPGGIAVLDGLRQVIVTLQDGTIDQLDLIGADQTHKATPVAFATGGFPSPYAGPIVRRGPDGSLFVIQAGTRYDDGTETPEYSIVRISPKEVRTEATTWGKLKAAYR